MTSRPPSPSRLASPVAHAILEAFRDHRARYLALTRNAQACFEERDWRRLRADARARFGLYRIEIDQAETHVRALLGEHCRERLVWMSAKAVYSALIARRQDWDLAETFFNGVTRRIFDTVGVDPLVEYVASDFDAPPTDASRPVYVRESGPAPTATLLQRVLEKLPFEAPWADRERDARRLAERVDAKVAELDRGHPVAIEHIESVFYRGKGAYVIGRVVLRAGVVTPLVLALRNGPEGIFVDAVLLDEDDVSILFSFTRSYFHVDVERPYDVMRFLRSLIPRKRIAEIYIALGEPKHGKTELYRAITDHIDESAERFGYAPGTPGLVMVVFTMPGMDVVMKVIRDDFPPQKDTSPEKVRERYGWVYTHDRAGRLVDAQEFEHLAFPKDRFEPELLEELQRECGKSVRVEEDRVILALCYAERQLTPLNLYVRREEQEAAERALEEWGEAIADLATCNIFPGDLLLKNFGVTRHGRVALYDYDELVALTKIHIRDLPDTDDIEDAMRAEPWFSVAHGDVFPEEFPRFLGLPRRLRPSTMQTCAHVFDPAWWRARQNRVKSGKVPEFSPYPESRKLPRD